MNILVVGNGGREHAMAKKLAEAPGSRVFITIGNAGTAQVATAIPVKPTDVDGIVAFARNNAIDLVAVGPEVPLAAGLADRLIEARITVFGPTAAGAMIEASKAFSHEVMEAAGVPSAGTRTFTDPDEALKYLSECPIPTVVKADGLAAGKGVVVAMTREEALEAARDMMLERSLGEAGGRLVVEEFLAGEEASFMCITDGRTVRPLASARDHKRIFDGDRGPNTGGMGAYSPTPLVGPANQQELIETVIRPVIRELARRGITYRGVLYAGLMLTARGVKVLEFNCRFGDPETQPILTRFRGNLAEVMKAAAEGRLDEVDFEFDDRVAVCLVLAAPGYPGKVTTGQVISGLDAAAEVPGVTVYHAGTKPGPEGASIVSGGRVLGVTALGNTYVAARDAAYQAASKISFDGMQFRRDIASGVC
jgi:phosphoribosylamine--glycine ligase